MDFHRRNELSMSKAALANEDREEKDAPVLLASQTFCTDEEIVVIWCHHQVKKEKKIVTWKLTSTSQYCKDKEILRTFRPTFTRIETWRRIVIFETSSDVISIKHHVGYILPNVADYIDIRIPVLVA